MTADTLDDHEQELRTLVDKMRTHPEQDWIREGKRVVSLREAIDAQQDMPASN